MKKLSKIANGIKDFDVASLNEIANKKIKSELIYTMHTVKVKKVFHQLTLITEQKFH